MLPQVMKRILVGFFAIVACAALLQAAEVPPIAPLLMESTFKIEGKTKDGKTSFGTCFILLKAIPGTTNIGLIMLITADHVLSDIYGDDATLNLRKKLDNGAYVKSPFSIKIRDKGRALWTRHPEVDVAAILLSLPNDIMASRQWMPEALLCGDAVYKERDLRPGDELMCLGYPLGVESNDAGFPVLRSGRIASYPVHPSTLVKSYYYDVPVYGGNSGGPVFFDFRKRQIPGLPPEQWIDSVGVAGILIQDLSSTVHIESYFETSTRKDPLGLAVVVPAEFIKQTVAILDAAQRDKRGEAKAPEGKK
jgi:hypothetical protein